MKWYMMIVNLSTGNNGQSAGINYIKWLVPQRLSESNKSCE